MQFERIASPNHCDTILNVGGSGGGRGHAVGVSSGNDILGVLAKGSCQIGAETF